MAAVSNLIMTSDTDNFVESADASKIKMALLSGKY